MDSNSTISKDPPSTPQAAEKVLVPALDHAPPPRGDPLRRWLRPGSAGFFLLVVALAAAGGCQSSLSRSEADEQAFYARVKVDTTDRQIIFSKAPDSASLRHLARLPGTWHVTFDGTLYPDPPAPQVLRGHRFPNVIAVSFTEGMDIDPWLREMSRPDSGFKSLASLYLGGTKVTDADLKELARPDSGLNALVELDLPDTKVTDAGLKELARPVNGLKALTSLRLYKTEVTDAGVRELARPDSGLAALTSLDLMDTKVTDAGLKELARPDSGLKALTSLEVRDTKVTDAGVAALKKARSGLTIVH